MAVIRSTQPLSFSALAAAGMVPTAKRGPIKVALQRCTVDTFREGDWNELANLLDQGLVVERHGRLLRALYFGDDDYSACADEVLSTLLAKELVESTVKVLLSDLRQPMGKTEDLPALITRLHQALEADPHDGRPN